FLRRYVLDADAYVFSRATFAWEGLERERIAVIQPSIDAFSVKNQPQSPRKSLSILARAGVVSHHTGGQATFARADGTPGRVDRRRVHLASLPMGDVEENAAIVNALQRHADVVVQKSLAEGFGLTVAEAMWKQRPVVASQIGGIQDQIVDGESGMLIADPRDL